MRAFNAAAVMIGFASHLVLDEIWSIDLRHFRLKSSFGTAVKLWGECWWSNALAYLNVAILALLIFEDPTINPAQQTTPCARQRALLGGQAALGRLVEVATATGLQTD